MQIGMVGKKQLPVFSLYNKVLSRLYEVKGAGKEKVLIVFFECLQELMPSCQPQFFMANPSRNVLEPLGNVGLGFSDLSLFSDKGGSVNAFLFGDAVVEIDFFKDNSSVEFSAASNVHMKSLWAFPVYDMARRETIGVLTLYFPLNVEPTSDQIELFHCFTGLITLALEWNETSKNNYYLEDAVKVSNDQFLGQLEGKVKATRELEISESKYKVLFERSADAIFLFKGQELIDCNLAAISLLKGKNKEEVLSNSLLLYSNDKEQVSFEHSAFYRKALGAGSGRFEVQIRKFDGKVVFADVLINSITIDNEKIVYVVCRDIDERKKGEAKTLQLNEDLEQRVKERTKELEKVQERYYYASLATQDVLYDLDLIYDHLLWHDNFYSTFRYDRICEFNNYESWEGLVHPEDRPKVISDFNYHLKQKKERCELEYRFLCGDGSYAYVINRFFILYNENAQPCRIVGSMIDITAHKQAELALEYQHKITQTITNNAKAGLFMMDKNGVCTFMNPSAVAMTGYTLEELSAYPLHNFILSSCPVDYDEQPNLQGIDIYKEKELWEMEENFIRKDGSIFPVSCSVCPIMEDGQVEGIVLEVHDITLEKKAQQEIIESAERLQMVLEAIPQIAWTARPDGGMNYYNRRWYEYTGQNYEQGKDEGWRVTVHPDDFAKTGDIWMASIQSGEICEIQNRLRAKDGEYRWHLNRGVPVRRADGEIFLWVGTCTDIHEYKLMLEDIEKARLELAEKNIELNKINMDLDNFIYTASHDLKSPIANIESLILILKKRMKDKLDDTEMQLFEMANISVNKFKKTILDLTEISKAQKEIGEKIEYLTFEEVLFTVNDEIHGLISESKAVIKTNFKKRGVYYPRKNLTSIVYNLLSNAIKFRAMDRPVEINLKSEDHGEYTLFTISDNGLGLKPDQVHKIFHMFKRLHNHVEGTGVGLYITKRIIENNGGRIEVESEADKGTTFKVYFKNIKDSFLFPEEKM
jgi:PAS domain S-box-containing protein